ncbi:hypothetical protein G6F32_014635 [Rhizopus arrhizus]|nr:hypothetical protein G6F32_014635 [Rhizopus arrhizus]
MPSAAMSAPRRCCSTMPCASRCALARPRLKPCAVTGCMPTAASPTSAERSPTNRCAYTPTSGYACGVATGCIRPRRCSKQALMASPNATSSIASSSSICRGGSVITADAWPSLSGSNAMVRP